MKFAIIVCARSTSSRLPQKHFRKLSKDMEALDLLFSRLNFFLKDFNPMFCLATTTEKADDVFKDHVSSEVNIYRGETNNIPKRQLDAAKEHGADFIIAVDGDDILVSPEAIRFLIEKVKSDGDRNNKIYHSSNLPLGMNVSVYSVSLLESSLHQAAGLKFETGWGRIFKNVESVNVPIDTGIVWDESYRFTLDYPEDLEFFSKVAEEFGEALISASTLDILKLVKQKNLFKLNSAVNARYWENFYFERDKEIKECKN